MTLGNMLPLGIVKHDTSVDCANTVLWKSGRQYILENGVQVQLAPELRQRRLAIT